MGNSAKLDEAHALVVEDPEILSGTPVIRNTRIPVYDVAASVAAGLPMDRILFVANHAFDCIGAKSAGMRTAFIDRRSRPFGETPHQPDILVPTMTALAEAIA